jgi:hypothetical protein
VLRQLCAHNVNLSGIAKPIEHNIGALSGKCRGDP